MLGGTWTFSIGHPSRITLSSYCKIGSLYIFNRSLSNFVLEISSACVIFKLHFFSYLFPLYINVLESWFTIRSSFWSSGSIKVSGSFTIHFNVVRISLLYFTFNFCNFILIFQMVGSPESCNICLIICIWRLHPRAFLFTISNFIKWYLPLYRHINVAFPGGLILCQLYKMSSFQF